SRDKILLNMLWKKLEIIPNLHIMASQHRDRLPIISFYIDNLDSYIGARLLNDKFAIQCKASRAAPGSYGYSLIKEGKPESQEDRLKSNQQHNPQLGWIRVSLHPVMMDEEIQFIADSIIQLANRHRAWIQYYLPDQSRNYKSQASINLDYQAQEAITMMFARSFVQ
ncbi:MAG: selenocysteine lyase, partial [Moorea sp. SIO4E2]|nr:selenocysteine lyase [Moorena sp. SIO4E2]